MIFMLQRKQKKIHRLHMIHSALHKTAKSLSTQFEKKKLLRKTKTSMRSKNWALHVALNCLRHRFFFPPTNSKHIG